jgi:glycosyltransferase domain-containing protein
MNTKVTSLNCNGLERWVEESLARKKLEENDGLEELARLTIVIPCYERQAFLFRQAVYWGGTQAKVIILDGSENPLSDSMQEVLAKLPNFCYRHARESFAQRMKLAAGLIQTPYVAMLGDDEFLLKTGLCSAIKRLEEDAGLVACCGQPVGFNFSRVDNSVKYFDSYRTFWRYSIKGKDVRDRLRKAMRTVNASTCYAVIRREAWVEGWGGLQAWSSPVSMDIYQIISTSIFGELECTDDLFWMRSSENSMIPDENLAHSAYNVKHTFQMWWHGSKYAHERKDFVCQLTKILATRFNLSDEESRGIIEGAVNIFLTVLARGMLLTFPNIIRTSISNTLRRFLSPDTLLAVKLRLLKVSGRATQGIQGDSVCGGIKFSDRNAPVYSPAELQSIEALILGFYKAWYTQIASVGNSSGEDL